jgi:sirohydrochlorin cobaltochelatase
MNSGALLVLFAHGSRDPGWRRPFEKLKALAQDDLGADKVDLAYMEFHPPGLEEIAQQAWAKGIGRIRILPLFLAGGAHVANDIPEQVQVVKRSLPHMIVDVLPPVGENPRFRSLLREITREEGLRLELESGRVTKGIEV